MAHFEFISQRNRERYFKIVGPVADLFARSGIHPNILSIAGLLLSIAAGLIYCHGSFFWAAWVVVLAGVCDTLDGTIARQTNKKSDFGAFFDSTLDRYSDMFIFIGLAYYFAGGRPFLMPLQTGSSSELSPWTVTAIIFAIVGSFMVSYTRARAEALGIECKAGIMQRPERITLLVIGSLLGAVPGVGVFLLKLVLLALAVSTNLTAAYRIMFVKNRMFRNDQAN
jgi:CDP-diacylglycerol---glycerol-3-phosphate 3-phosphatidyltransferase